MPLRRELLLAVGVLTLLNLALAFGCIGLFARMGPAIDRIMRENSYSIQAAEEILAELARAGGKPIEADGRKRVEAALERAKLNVTVADERSVLRRMDTVWPEAATRDLTARRQLVAESEQLIRINRDAMYAVDREAQRLGRAGAWASVLVGFVSFVASLLVIGRLRRRLVAPLEDLDQVLESASQGDRHRRCQVLDAPVELRRLAETVNHVLDERLSERR